MIYKIQKSLGNVSAILVDNIINEGICLEFKNFGQTDASIIIYTDGKPQDIVLNGYTFPCVYNNIKSSRGDDIYGGKYFHKIEFEYLIPDGSINKIIKDNLYGAKESLAIEYFYSLLYNISCCANIAQYEQLYKYIIDNRLFGLSKKRENALTILNFIEEFIPELGKLQQTAFLPGLKQKINAKFKEAQEVIQMSNCPD